LRGRGGVRRGGGARGSDHARRCRDTGRRTTGVSAGQVSSAVGISVNVQIEPEAAELVRCAACHCLYEPAQAVGTALSGDGCPECGGTAWLAVRVPVDQTSTSFEQ